MKSGGAPPAKSDPFAYTTDFGQGQVARVVYQTDKNHIEELSKTASGNWQKADLYEGINAPPANGAPHGYMTDLPGQGPVARVVYPTFDAHIEELSLKPGGKWQQADLTMITDAPDIWSDVFAYSTDFGQGQVARVIYRTGYISTFSAIVADHIEELSNKGGDWQKTDLSDIADAPAADGSPFGYQTNLPGQGPAARVLYRNNEFHIEELNVTPGGSWHAADLTKITGAPDVIDEVFGYETDLTGEPTKARVVYQAAHHIYELSVVAGGAWQPTDLNIDANPAHSLRLDPPQTATRMLLSARVSPPASFTDGTKIAGSRNCVWPRPYN